MFLIGGKWNRRIVIFVMIHRTPAEEGASEGQMVACMDVEWMTLTTTGSSCSHRAGSERSGSRNPGRSRNARFIC